MRKILVCVLLIVILSGCTSSNNNSNQTQTNKTNKTINQKDHEFEALNSSFCITLSNDWFIDEDVETIQTEPLMQSISYKKRKKYATTMLMLFSKIYFETPLELDIADSAFEKTIKNLKREVKDFKELEHPADYEDATKTIKRFCCEVTMKGFRFREIISLIEFKDSDKIIICSQICHSEDWDNEKDSLFKIVDSIHIKQKSK